MPSLSRRCINKFLYNLGNIIKASNARYCLWHIAWLLYINLVLIKIFLHKTLELIIHNCIWIKQGDVSNLFKVIIIKIYHSHF